MCLPFLLSLSHQFDYLIPTFTSVCVLSTQRKKERLTPLSESHPLPLSWAVQSPVIAERNPMKTPPKHQDATHFCHKARARRSKQSRNSILKKSKLLIPGTIWKKHCLLKRLKRKWDKKRDSILMKVLVAGRLPHAGTKCGTFTRDCKSQYQIQWGQRLN